MHRMPVAWSMTGDRQRKIWMLVRGILAAVVILMAWGAGADSGASVLLITALISAACVILPFGLHIEPQPEGKERRSFLRRTALRAAVWGGVLLGLLSALWMAEQVHGFRLWNLKARYIRYNLWLALAIFFLVYLISNRVKVSLMLTWTLVVGFSVLNYYVNEFRGEAISAADIFAVGTALNVAGSYRFEITVPVVQCALGAEILLALLHLLPAEKNVRRGWRRWKVAIPAAIYIVVIFWLFGVSDWPKQQRVVVKLFEPMITYERYGQLLNFTRGFYYMLVDTPEGYSAKECRERMEALSYVSDDVAEEKSEERPNLIVIMNESLSDFSSYNSIEPSEDPLAFIHSLEGKENAILGNLHVDVFGGRTANSEYEVLTGNSLLFMPQNAVPYAMYVRREQPALPWNMQDLGYAGVQAFHPYKANGYSRPRAYPNLGFSSFVALEDVEASLREEDYLRNWVSDAADFRLITEMYEESKKESDDPFFLFNVTMQNHGSYVQDYDNFHERIRLGGKKYREMSEASRFINLLGYSDQAFRQLTEYFSGVEEPTILVMFGDHMPALHDSFYWNLWGMPGTALQGEERLKRYVTPLVIWANYDINENGRYNSVFDDISVNYLGAELTDLAGLPLTAYQKFLIDMQKDIPVATIAGYLDAEGNYYDPEDTNLPFQDWLTTYSYLEYNNQFDARHREETFFSLQKD